MRAHDVCTSVAWPPDSENLSKEGTQPEEVCLTRWRLHNRSASVLF